MRDTGIVIILFDLMNSSMRLADDSAVLQLNQAISWISSDVFF